MLAIFENHTDVSNYIIYYEFVGIKEIEQVRHKSKITVLRSKISNFSRILLFLPTLPCARSDVRIAALAGVRNIRNVHSTISKKFE